MGRKVALSEAENSKITQRIQNNVSNLERAKELRRDHPTVKEFAINPAHCNGPSDKGKIRKQAPVLHRAMNHILIEVRRNPL